MNINAIKTVYSPREVRHRHSPCHVLSHAHRQVNKSLSLSKSFKRLKVEMFVLI